MALSPDGRNIVFVAGTQSVYRIWQRQVAALDATPIPGTEGGAFPFWSPDSRSVGFFADGKLKKIQVSGGPPTILSDAPAGRGGSWSRDDVIVFATAPRGDVGLVRVSSGGGEATAVTKLDPTTGETSHRWPHFLPDGRHFLYTASTGTCCPAPQPARVRIGSLDDGEPAVTLFEAESSVSYSAGYLLFARDSTLLAQPFDVDTRRTTGDAFPIAAGISWEGSRYVGAAVSQTGTLVYSRDNSQVAQPLTWFDRQGRVLGTLGPAFPYVDLAIAPQERRVAVAVNGTNGANRDVWLIDIDRNVPSRQTFAAGTDGSPVWSPDGTRVVFGRLRSGTGNGSLHQKLINTSEADTLLLDADGVILSPTDWSRDGRFIAYTVTRGFPPALDIWVLPLFGDRKPFPLAQTAFIESSAVFSPDGRWVAYSTDEGGQSNVYVQPFLRAGGKYPISTEGGIAPIWRADGKELFYLATDGTLMATTVDAVGEFAAGVPTPLFQTRAMAGFTTFGFGSVTRLYDATRDGQRFIVNARAASVAPLTVVLNWTSTISRPALTPLPAN